MTSASSTTVGPVTIVTPRRHLPVRMRLAAPLDDNELQVFCAHNPELRIEQTAQGELIIMQPTGANTGNRNFKLNGQFFGWVEQSGTGEGFDSSTGFKLPNGATRSPDLSWVAKERWHALTDEQRDGFAPICPDFVVELRSPTDDLQEQRAKLEEYIECGARLGWLIDPSERRVYVHRPGRATETLDHPAELRGDPELPGLVLDPTVLW